MNRPSSWFVNLRRSPFVANSYKNSFIIQLSALNTRKQQINLTVSVFVVVVVVEKRATSNEQQVSWHLKQVNKSEARQRERLI